MELNSRNIQYYKDKGYNIPTYTYGKIKPEEKVKRGTKIIVQVNDLPLGSHARIDIQCDYCNEIINTEYKHYFKTSHDLYIQTDCCIKCKNIKAQEVFEQKYGNKSIMKVELIKDNLRNSIFNKYGVTSVAKLESVKNKTVQTMQIKYGVDCFSQTNEFKKFVCGEKNVNWKGGITPDNERIRHSIDFKEWRNLVFTRDNYSCQCCGDSKGGNLQAHHILNFAEHIELRFDVSNGITLCKNCHDFQIIGSFHHTYGTKYNNKEQLEEYLNNYLKISS